MSNFVAAADGTPIFYRDFGQGQPATGNDMDTYADDLAAVIEALDLKAVEIIPNATLTVYEGAPHAVPTIFQDRLNADLLAFIKA